MTLYRLLSYGICHVDIVYRHIVIVYCHIVILFIVASMLPHVHHHIARPLGPPYILSV